MFTEKEIEILKELYPTKSNYEIALTLNKSWWQIKETAESLGLRKSKFRRDNLGFSDEEINIIKEYYPKYGYAKVHELAPRLSRSSVAHKAMRLGVKVEYDWHSELGKRSKGRIPSDETRRKMSLSFLNGRVIPAIDGRLGKKTLYFTPLQGKVWFRSLAEAKFADKILSQYDAWLYEPTRFLLPCGKVYIPDFYVLDLDSWFEVKGVFTDLNKLKVREFIGLGYNLTVVDYRYFSDITKESLISDN